MLARLAAIVVALSIGFALVFVLVVALSLTGVRDSTLIDLASVYAAGIAGLALVAARNPELFRNLPQRALKSTTARLGTPAQRTVFLVGVAASVPWFLTRVVAETFQSSTIRDYAREAYLPLINTLFPVSNWFYQPAWYDWLMLWAIACIALALLWPAVASPLVRWVRRG
jgi:hypothetical protein